MIVIKPLPDEPKFSALEIRHSQFFKEYIRAIQLIPVSIYNKSDKQWNIPTNDLIHFIKILKQENLPYKIIGKESLQKEIKFERKKLSFLRTLRNINSRNVPGLIIKSLLNFFDLFKDDLKLYPFQALGAYYCYKAVNSFICDRVGLGKTVQSIAVSEKRFLKKQINFTFIICPNTLKRNWEIELDTFTNKNVMIINGTKVKRKQLYKKAYKYDYMIIQYDIIKNDFEMIKEYILTKGFRIQLIIDEIQYIKNKNTVRAKSVDKISQYCNYKIGLSATLVENTLNDVFNPFQVIDNSVLGSRSNYLNFQRRYFKYDFFGRIIDHKNVGELKNRIEPYFIRRQKEDVLDQLPKRIENNYWIELSEIQKQFYNDIASGIVEEIENLDRAEKIKTAPVLAMITYLRLATLSAKLVGHKQNISTKSDELFNLFDSIGNSKIVIFCYFAGMVELLAEEMKERKIDYLAMHGDRKRSHYLPQVDRIDTVKDWDNSKYQQILITSDILREGVSILNAGYVVNFDLLWNPQRIEQRIGRLDRITTNVPTINIINFIATGTIEEHIYEVQHNKKLLSTEVMDSGKIEKRISIKDIYNFLNTHKL